MVRFGKFVECKTSFAFALASLLSITAFGAPVFTSRYARMVYATAFGLGAFVTTVLLNQPAPDIVYKAF
jgi:hypothetical protein